MTDFLLELLSEEIPARMQARARNDLGRLFAECTGEAGLTTGPIDVFSTPRRLVLIARDVADATEASREEIKGPRVNAPAQALDGFLRKTGLSRDQLEERDGVLFAVVERGGQGAAEILADAVKRIIADFPWPKSMRWGNGDLRWVRPLHGIVAMLGDEIVPIEIHGIESGATTVGHRFHHPGPITIGGAADYAQKLRACHVIVDQDERERLIREGAAAVADAAGLRLLEDEGLVVENAGLTEWPVPLVGRFDPEFLDVPREVIVLTMRTNQKYFACTVPPLDGEGDRSAQLSGGGGAVRGSEPPPSVAGAAATSPSRGGALAPAFVCVSNIAANDGGEAIAQGNARVLAARLADARFFWEQDLKVPLEEQATKLDGIVFHEKLGTVADKVERVAKLARWLVEKGIVSSSSRHSRESGNPAAREGSGTPASAGVTNEGLADLAERAARLAKADLVTGMVGEFPELQGVIGGYIAEAQGEPRAIADAIRDHYKPAGQGDGVPSAPVTVAVALADKLDTLVGFFQFDEKPTGSKDPFALRRAALGILGLIIDNQLRVSMRELITAAAHAGGINAGREIASFLIERLKVQQREAGIRHDMIDAVVAVEAGGDNVRMVRRVRALQDFVDSEDGADLLTAYKRAANILKKENWVGPQVMSSAEEQGIPQTGEEDPLVLVDDPIVGEAVAEIASGHAGADLPQEQALIAALDAAEPKASAAIDAEDFTAAMAALASLRTPIDQFFDHVTVNDPDAAKRERRLNLLMRFRDAVNRVADFSKIEG
jgi:glycyl-tRNA synthetase beta chain